MSERETVFNSVKKSEKTRKRTHELMKEWLIKSVVGVIVLAV